MTKTMNATLKWYPKFWGCTSLDFDCVIEYTSPDEWDFSFQNKPRVTELYTALYELGSFDILALNGEVK